MPKKVKAFFVHKYKKFNDKNGTDGTFKWLLVKGYIDGGNILNYG